VFPRSESSWTDQYLRGRSRPAGLFYGEYILALTKEQKKLRRLSIGGSDIAAIANLSPHKSAFQLYLEKISDEDPEDETESDSQLWGQILEAPVAEFYAKRHGVEIQSFTEPLVHPEYEFITANPDRAVIDLERLIEIKTTGLGGIEFWRDTENPRSLRPPQHVILQVNHYLGFLGWKEADIALLQFCEGYSNPDRYIEFPVEFDPELFDLEIQLAINFWINNVQARVAPEATDPGEVSEYLSHTYKVHSEEMIESNQETDQIAARLSYAGDQEKHWKNQKIIESNSLKEVIGEKAGICGKDWLYTWKKTKASGTDWKALSLSKHPTDAEFKKFAKSGYRRQYFRYKGDAVE